MENITIDRDDYSKIVKIKNKEGKIQFIVSFLDLKQENSTNGRYLVKVREITNLYVPEDIIRQFFKEDEEKEAQIYFLKMIKDYEIAADSLPTEKSPREMFDDSINYHIIDPDCCFNCVHSVFKDVPKSGKRDLKPRIFCSCKKNISHNENINRIFRYLEENEQPQVSSVVEVSENGICDNYNSLPREAR